MKGLEKSMVNQLSSYFCFGDKYNLNQFIQMLNKSKSQFKTNINIEGETNQEKLMYCIGKIKEDFQNGWGGDKPYTEIVSKSLNQYFEFKGEQTNE